MKNKSKGPQFNCDIELLRSTKCSIIRLFDILSDKIETSYESLFRSFSYLPKCDFNKLLNGNLDYLQNSYDSILKLFDLVIINYDQNPIEVVSNEQLRVLFCFVKKSINSMRIQKDIFSSQEASLQRLSIVDFLNFLKRFVYLICDFSSKNSGQNLNIYEVLSFILKELRNLVIFTGRISQFRKDSFQSILHNSDPSSSLYNHYHSTLDIWWSTIEISFIIQQQTNFSFHEVILLHNSSTKLGINFQKIPLLEQTLQIFFYDLHCLTFDNFKNFNQNCYYQSNFTCTCCWEVMFLIKTLYEKHLKIQSFYDFQLSILNLFHQNHSSNNQKINEEVYIDAFDNYCYDLSIQDKQEFNLFVLWNFVNISPLLPLEISSDNRCFYSQYNRIAIPDYVIKILRLSLTSFSMTKNVQDENNLKLLLILTTKIFEFLPILNLDVVTLYLDYYLKRLNQNFETIQVNSIENYAFLPKDSLDWYNTVRSNDLHSLDPNRFKNSFELFLRFLKISIYKIQYSDGSKNILQRFAAKIRISLQPKTLQNLELIGIYNLFTIFLSITSTSKDDSFQKLFREKIISSLQEIFKNHCKNNVSNKSIAELILKFCFTILLINPSENIFDDQDDKNSFLIETLTIFNNILQELQNHDVKVYFNYLKLFFSSCQDLLRSLKKTQISIVFIEKILQKIDFSNIYQFLKKFKRSGDMFKSFEHLKVIEFLTELIEYSCKMFDEDVSFIQTKMDNFLKQDLIKNFNQNDANSIANFGYFVSKLGCNRLDFYVLDILNYSKNSFIFQLEYLCLLFDDFDLCSILKENKSKELRDTIVETWLKCLPSYLEQNPSKYWLFTKKFFDIYFEEIRLEEEKNHKELILDCFDKYLEYSKYQSNQMNSRITLFNEMNCLIKECTNSKQNLTILVIISRVVDKLSTYLYQMGKFDSPMVAIFESFLQKSWKNSVILSEQNLLVCAIIQIFKGVFRLQINGDSYLQRKVRQMVQTFLPQLVEEYTYSKLNFEFRNFIEIWNKTIESSLEKHFLTSLNLIQTNQLADYLFEYCNSIITNLTPYCVVLIKNLNLGETLTQYQSKFIQKLFSSAFNKLHTPDDRKAFIDNVLILFMEKNFSSRPVKAFEMFRFILGEDITKNHPLFFHEICSSTYRFIDHIETKSVSGQNTVLRNLYRDFIKRYS